MDSNDRTCPLCLEDFKEPKILPCVHKFCKKCLEDLWTKGEGGNSFSCPNCREGYTVPDRGVDAYPSYFAAQTSPAQEIPLPEQDIPLPEQEIPLPAQEIPLPEEEATCKSCEDECALTAYCHECGGWICENCVDLHRRIKKLKSHEVVASEDFSLDSFKPQPNLKYCSKHGKELELFCEQCGCPLCSKCLVSPSCPHHSHIKQVKEIEEVREKKEEEVRGLRERAEKMLRTSKERVQYLTEVGEKMATYPEEVARIINDTFDEYAKTLDTWRRQQLQEASEKAGKLMKQVSSQTIDQKNLTDKLQSGIDLADRALKCTTNVDAVTMSGLAITQLDVEPLPAHLPLCRPLVFSKGQFRLGGLTEIAAGNIKVTTPEVCIMSEPVAINVTFGVIFHTKPLIKVLYGTTKQRSILLEPESIENNTCTVTYQPRCAGKHNIEVHINGAMCAEKHDIMDVEGAPEIGAKVKPGPDWQEEEEGEVGESGIVLNVEMGKGPTFAGCYYVLTVQWENVQEKKYDWGRNDRYELELDI